MFAGENMYTLPDLSTYGFFVNYPDWCVLLKPARDKIPSRRLTVPLTVGSVLMVLIFKMSMYKRISVCSSCWRLFSSCCGRLKKRQKDGYKRLATESDVETEDDSASIDNNGMAPDAEELKREREDKIQAMRQLNEMQAKCDELRQKLETQVMATRNAQIRLKEEETAKEDALIRLSEQIALKLADNNPNIADLSDINRPTNLVEKFSQLYDDKWTDALDALLLKPELEEEPDAIKKLLEILMECYQFCREKAGEQIQSMLRIDNSSIPLESVPTELKKLLKETRKKCAFVYIPLLCQILDERLPENHRNLLQDDKVRAYLERCTELCWLMSVQDPPMALTIDVGEDSLFRKAKYREYTKSGPLIDYVVWPIVLLHDDGNLMAKGIAQCRNKLAELKETEMEYKDTEKSIEKNAHILDDHNSTNKMAEDVLLLQYHNDLTGNDDEMVSDTISNNESFNISIKNNELEGGDGDSENIANEKIFSIEDVKEEPKTQTREVVKNLLGETERPQEERLYTKDKQVSDRHSDDIGSQMEQKSVKSDDTNNALNEIENKILSAGSGYQLPSKENDKEKDSVQQALDNIGTKLEAQGGLCGDSRDTAGTAAKTVDNEDNNVTETVNKNQTTFSTDDNETGSGHMLVPTHENEEVKEEKHISAFADVDPSTESTIEPATVIGSIVSEMDTSSTSHAHNDQVVRTLNSDKKDLVQESDMTQEQEETKEN